MGRKRISLPRKRKSDIGCPRHGMEHMTHDKSSCYCNAPTPGEAFSKCFYHPTLFKVRKQREDTYANHNRCG